MPLFRFGVPWGWRDAEPDALAQLPGVSAGIVTDRPDRVTTAIIVQGPIDDPVWSETDGGIRLRAYANEFAEMRIRQPHNEALGPMTMRAPPERAVLAGEPALVLRFRQLVEGGVHENQAMWSETELWTVHGGRLYGVLLQGPEADAEVYEPDYHTVLATWHWLA